MIDAQNTTTTLYSYQSGIGANTEAILNRTLRQRVNNGTGVMLEINSNADLYYHVLSNYIAVGSGK